ncbi:MAG: SBBP repeat-containing protein [Candidatus Sulfopaludibacter sp.]|nr:SBBP repeat-containing protein [Candidatus Sulfopaludibacter sp.]
MSVPLSFEPNQGQAASAVQFLSRGSGYALFLAPGKVVLNLERQTSAGESADTLRMSLIGSNPQANAVARVRQAGVVSYFIGNDPKKWRSGIPTYGKVEYPQIYPGVDLVFYGNQRQLEYDFVVAPGADPSRIAWQVEGARAGVDAKGDLTLSTPDGPVSFKKPVLYQMDGGKRTSVEGSFAVAGDQVRFRLGNYDHSRALTIDPVLSYASYIAGVAGTQSDTIGAATGPGISQNGTSQGIALDSAGSAYVTGTAFSKDFPTQNAYQSSRPAKLGEQPGGTYATTFVTKFSPDGSTLLYSTYLGGNGSDHGYAIAVDSSGNAYVTGMTNSVNFPITAGAYQTICDPAPNNTGESSASASCNSSNVSVFVTKLNSTGTGIVYSTFMGGYAYAYATAIAVDSTGRAYIAGNEEEYCSASYTFQGCFPTTGGAVIGGNATGGGSPQYAFVAAFDPAGAHLLYSTLFGDLNFDSGGGTYGTGVTVDQNGYFYLVGETQAGKLPTTAGVIQPNGVPLGSTGLYVQTWRGFVAKFNPVTSPGGASLAWSTYLGGKTGNTGDYMSGIAVDSASNVYVVGYTNSNDFPVTPGTYGTVCAPGGGTCAAAHVTKLDPNAQHILWSTYVGGSKHDGSDTFFFTGPIQLDGQGNVYIMGQSGGTGFPLVNPVEPLGSGGSQEVIVAELDSTGANLLFSTRIGSGGVHTSGPAGLAVDSAGDIYLAGNIIGQGLITTPGAFQTTTSDSAGGCYHGFVAKIAATTAPQITVTGSSSAVVNAATWQTGGIAPNEFISIVGTGLGPAAGVSGLTTQLGGTSVYIGGTAAYLIYASNTLVNALVPFGVSGLQSTTIQAEYNGVKGNSVTVPIVSASPGIFTQSYGPGQAWVVNQDNTFNSSSNPAARNSYIAFWVTGQGLVNTSLQDGAQPTSPWPTPMLPVSVSVGGIQVPAANIIFDGLIFTGEMQINIQIPANAPTGAAVPLVVTIGGASSRADATVAIQ